MKKKLIKIFFVIIIITILSGCYDSPIDVAKYEINKKYLGLYKSCEKGSCELYNVTKADSLHYLIATINKNYTRVDTAHISYIDSYMFLNIKVYGGYFIYKIDTVDNLILLYEFNSKYNVHYHDKTSRELRDYIKANMYKDDFFVKPKLVYPVNEYLE